MHLIAGRFVRSAAFDTLDLATNRVVTLRRLATGSRALQIRWEARCAEVARVRRAQSPALLDYGLLGPAGRYEAWSLRPRRLGHPVNVHAKVRLQPRSALRTLGAVLENARPGMHRVAVHGPRGSGLKTTVAQFARVASRLGYAPVCLSALVRCDGLIADLAGRHVVLLDDRGLDDPVPGLDEWLWRSVLKLGSRSARHHVLVEVTRDLRDRRAVRLDRMPPAALAAMVGVRGADPRRWPPAIRRAVEAADGWPGPFLAALHHPLADGWEGPAADRPRAIKAGEARAVYFSEPFDPAVGPAAPFDAQLERAVDLQRRGRHAAAERRLRQTLAAARRRDLTACAGSAGVRLGRLLASRGRLTEALSVLEAASESCSHNGAAADALDIGIAIGGVLMDLGRLAEGEAALRGAWIAASATSNAARRWQAALKLAWCLFWAGRDDEAEQLIAGGEAGGPSCAGLLLLTRIALARGDHPAAGRHAAAALESAGVAGSAGMAAAHEAMALVQSAVGQTAVASEHVRSGIDAARAAHDPFSAISLRLVLLDVLNATGKRNVAQRLAARLRHKAMGCLPPLLRARVDVATAACSADKSLAIVARAFVRRSGAAGLIRPPRGEQTMDVLHDVIDMLHLCQDAEDEPAVLSRVCARVRERLHASAAVVCAGSASSTPLSIAGPRSERTPDVARRAIETGLLIPPAVGAEGVEAAAPVRYGGTTIGALACRWSMDAVPDAVRAGALLTGAAAVCAPSLRSALDRLAAPRLLPAQPHTLLGVSAAMEEVRRAVARAAGAPFPVLIEGESGSGKELVARAVHALGSRRDRKFCAVNCAALTDDLLESELFGHSRGAFTGALTERAGLFEEADEGTLFLDEAGELSARAQAKLLRTLQEGEIRRVGENFPRRVDVRVIAATNRTLAAEARAGRFRQDLLYRLDVIRIAVPPLRARVEDIPVLAAHFWQLSIARTGSRASLDPETLAVLARYDWPGNVRELQNVMAALAVTAPRRGRVGPAVLPDAIARAGRTGGVRLDEARLQFDRRFVRSALARTGGHRGRAAAELGLTRQGLAKLIERLQLDESVCPVPGLEND
jgi:DNA-binding NtrC family response regulator